MKKILFLFLLIFVNNNAYSENLFESQFYHVEFISNDIEEQKIKKINEVKIESITNLLKKTLDNNQFIKIRKDIDLDFTNSLIMNVIINDEKIINDKYISKIKINFNKKKIISYFQTNKIPYVEYYPGEFLLIIYEEDGINQNLFSDNNSFYKYFLENLEQNKFFKIPKLDINDRYILDKKDLENKDLDKIKIFSNKYKINNVIIVIVKKNKNKVIYNILLYSDEEILEKKINFEDYDHFNFFNKLEFETLNLWKSIHQIENQTLNIINCTISYYNISELKEIRSKLMNASLIKDLKIKYLSYKKINYDIYYYGKLKILFNILKLNQLKIHIADNLCNLKLI